MVGLFSDRLQIVAVEDRLADRQAGFDTDAPSDIHRFLADGFSLGRKRHKHLEIRDSVQLHELEMTVLPKTVFISEGPRLYAQPEVGPRVQLAW